MPQEDVGFTEQQLQQFRRQLAQHGALSLERSRTSLARRLAEHERKLEQARDAGGYTSSMEREVRNFRQQIAAIDELLGAER